MSYEETTRIFFYPVLRSGTVRTRKEKKYREPLASRVIFSSSPPFPAENRGPVILHGCGFFFIFLQIPRETISLRATPLRERGNRSEVGILSSTGEILKQTRYPQKNEVGMNKNKNKGKKTTQQISTVILGKCSRIKNERVAKKSRASSQLKERCNRNN